MMGRILLEESLDNIKDKLKQQNETLEREQFIINNNNRYKAKKEKQLGNKCERG